MCDLRLSLCILDYDWVFLLFQLKLLREYLMYVSTFSILMQWHVFLTADPSIRVKLFPSFKQSLHIVVLALQRTITALQE